MKQIKILLAGFAAMAISFVSCTNDFDFFFFKQKTAYEIGQ